MKPAILITGAVACFLTFMSCDPNGSKTQDSKISTTTDTAMVSQTDSNTNFCVDETTGREMIAEFDSTFRKVNGKIQKAIIPDIMIESHTIISISEFLRDNKYDGFRIYMGASQFEEYPAEERKNKTMFIGVPTLKAHDTLHHPDDWDVKVPVKGESRELKLNLVKSFSHAAVRKFKEVYRIEKDEVAEIDNFSKAVWIPKVLIGQMAKLLSDTANGLSGFKLYAGAYSKKNPRVISQKHDIQSTILLVPINKVDGSENWIIFKNCNITDKASIVDAANHGELCPKNCPPTEP